MLAPVLCPCSRGVVSHLVTGLAMCLVRGSEFGSVVELPLLPPSLWRDPLEFERVRVGWLEPLQ